MKKIYTLFAMLLMAVSVQAQTPMFSEGDEIVSLGIGLGGGKTYGMPITLSYEQGFKDLNDKSTIGLGGSVSYQYSNYNNKFNGSYDSWGYAGLVLAVTGSYHYDLLKDFDLFADVSLGYAMGRVKVKNNGDSASVGDNYFYYGVGIGARYYFTDGLGAYIKLGATPTSFFNVGVAYRFSVKELVNKL